MGAQKDVVDVDMTCSSLCNGWDGMGCCVAVFGYVFITWTKRRVSLSCWLRSSLVSSVSSGLKCSSLRHPFFNFICSLPKPSQVTQWLGTRPGATLSPRFSFSPSIPKEMIYSCPYLRHVGPLTLVCGYRCVCVGGCAV